MEALKLVAEASECKLSIVVPEEFNGRALDITIRVKEQANNSVTLTEEIILLRRDDFGKAPFPNHPTNKYDVYNQ